MNTDTATGHAAAPLSRHRSVWEVRTESWIELVDELSQLANRTRAQTDREARLAHLHELTEVLTPIEVCWAYPGRRAFADLCGYIARGELAHAAIVARRSHRMLASLTYRHGNPGAASDTELPTQMETEREFQTQMRCPYFEVLMVDDLPAEEEESLRRRVRSRRRPDDDFIFDVVVVPTFEDALVASMVNFNLQAVVIGYGFPYHSLYVPELVVRRFFEGMDVSGEQLPESERGLLLGQQIALLRPELDLYLVTDARVEDVAAKAGATFKRVFFGEEDQLELHFSIMKGVAERYQRL